MSVSITGKKGFHSIMNSAVSLHSPEESPDRSRYSSTESLYQEGDKASLGSLETGGTKMEDLVKTVIFLKDKMKEFEKEMSGNSGSIKVKIVVSQFFFSNQF